MSESSTNDVDPEQHEDHEFGQAADIPLSLWLAAGGAIVIVLLLAGLVLSISSGTQHSTVYSNVSFGLGS